MGIFLAILSTITAIDTVMLIIIIHAFITNESKYRQALRLRHTLLDEVEIPYEEVSHALKNLKPNKKPGYMERAKSASPKLKLNMKKQGKTLVRNK
jgi:hypothetical protein